MLALLLACCACAETVEAIVDPEVDLLEVDHKLYELGYRVSA